MLTHVFEVGVAHVFDGEGEDVGILVGGGLDCGEEGCIIFFGGFLLNDGGVDDAGAF